MKIYRHELKYFLNDIDKELLKQRLDCYLEHDRHAESGEYIIRSMYFDDAWATAYEDKVNGLNKRKKYRIRIYNNSDKIIRLECKNKVDQYILKVSAALSREECDKILAGDCGFLLKREEKLCHEFYFDYVTTQLRPATIVDYVREPYVLKAGDVRITFDMGVKGASPFYSMFDNDVPMYDVLEDGRLILEVKYTEFCPTIIKELIQSVSTEFTAASKYVLCYEKVGFLYADAF